MSGLYIDGNAFVLASNAGHRTQSHNRNECNADPKHKSKGERCACVCVCAADEGSTLPTGGPHKKKPMVMRETKRN